MINMKPEKKALLQILSIRLGFSCREVRPQEQSCRIEDLLAGRPHSCTGGKMFQDEMLIMDGFSHTDLDFLLNEMARTGNTVPLKAVSTSTNLSWTVRMLHEQIAEEHRRMQMQNPEARL